MSEQYKLMIDKITPVDRPTQRPARDMQIGPMSVQANELVRAKQARQSFGVNGSGVTVAVLDTGLRTTHVDFAGRVVTQRNYTADNHGDPSNARDGHGHGTNVAGIIVANGIHEGIAPGAGVIPMKVLSNSGGGSFAAVRDALQWILDHHGDHDITCANLSLGDSGNYEDDGIFTADEVRNLVDKLAEKRIAVVAAAGNDFYRHGSVQGMGYPAILSRTVSVGAVYDADEGSFSYRSGAVAYTTGPDRITPFTQRLHSSVSPLAFTKIFGPGAPVTSSGIDSDHGASTQHGTSQASPVVAGAVLLLQSYYKSETGELPEVSDIIEWLRTGAAETEDGDDEDDNVTNTGLTFLRTDCVSALNAAKRHIERAAIGLPPKRQEFVRPAPASGLTLHQGTVRPLSANTVVMPNRGAVQRDNGLVNGGAAGLSVPGIVRGVAGGAGELSSTLENPQPQGLRPLDDRIIVARPNVYPNRCVGQIIMRMRNGRVFQGSGSLLSDYTVLTAGHMVKGNDNAFFDIASLHFIPAKNHGNEPYGRFDWTYMRAVNSGSRDWCLISLARPAGFSVGFLGAHARLPISRWVGTSGLSHIGFPGDHRDEMWIDEEGSVIQIDEARQLRTNIDAAAGQSGGPLVRNWFGSNPQVVGSLIEGPNPVEDPNDFMPGWETSKDDTWMHWLCNEFGNRHADDRFGGCAAGNAIRNGLSPSEVDTGGQRPITSADAVLAEDDGPDVRRFRPAGSLGVVTPRTAWMLEDQGNRTTHQLA